MKNKLTAFIQLCWLSKKFGADKRAFYLSSMIVSGQMSRGQTQAELAEPLYDEMMMVEYIAVIKKCLGLSVADFDRIMAAPAHEHADCKVDKLDPIIRNILSRK